MKQTVQKYNARHGNKTTDNIVDKSFDTDPPIDPHLPQVKAVTFDSDIVELPSSDPPFHDAEEDLFLDPKESPFEDDIPTETNPSISAASTDLYTPMISSIHDPSPSKPFSNLSFDDFLYLQCESELFEFNS